MELEHFRIEIDEGIATVTFDRPPVNAQNRKVREEITRVFDTLSEHPDVGCVILTGAGKVFSAGADIKERAGMTTEHGDYLRHNRLTREGFYAIRDCTRPVICAVNGPAIGAGFAIMANCDILLMAEGAWVQMPEVDVGLAGGAKFLELLPRSKARLMMFTARKIPAEELYRLGVIEACLPQAQLMPAAREIAREIAAKSRVVMQRVKHSFAVVEDMPLRDGYRFEQGVSADLSRSRDAREAQRAFVDKRPADFTGGD